MPPLPPIALTMGEPSGIGGEITLSLWSERSDLDTPFFVIDRPDRLREIASQIGKDIPVQEILTPAEAPEVFDTALPVLPLSATVDATPGEPSSSNAKAVLESIERAATLSVAGEAAAVVTNPIQKETLYTAGFTFPGHTEYLAELSQSDNPAVMMLASPRLRVVPVTVHVSLRDALDALSTELIVEHAIITAAALETDFGIAKPRLAVAGLNPHAGEGGTLGTEDRAIVFPAIEQLSAKGIAASGPVPPDALFTERARAGFDAAICMYHDQALIPIKALDFDEAVNVTLGLPIVRTSPDHGTALDIAGRGTAAPASLKAAAKMATEIASNRCRDGV